MEIWIMRYRVKKTEAPAKHSPPQKKTLKFHTYQTFTFPNQLTALSTNGCIATCTGTAHLQPF